MSADRFARTHGRWPLGAAAMTVPVSLAAARDPRWRPLAALVWHQTEEWVWPGGFLPWINHELLGSDEDEFPLDRTLGFGINVLFGWGFSLAAFAPERSPELLGTLYVSHLGNLGLHLSWALRHRRYDPGVATAVLTLLPCAVLGGRDLRRDERVSRTRLSVGVLGGLALSAGLSPLLRRRARTRRTG